MRFSVQKAAILSGVLLVVWVAGVVGLKGYYSDRLLPNTKIGGVDVGGLKTNVAADRLEDKSRNLKLDLVWGTNKYQFGDVRYKNSEIVARAAMEGRKKEWLVWLKTVLIGGETVSYEPAFEMDQAELGGVISLIKQEIDVPAQEPQIIYEPSVKTVKVTAGENGQEVNINELNQRVLAAIRKIDRTPIQIPVSQLRPKLSAEQITKAESRAKQMVDKKLKVELAQEKQVWDIDTEQLISWIKPGVESAQSQYAWKTDEIEKWVDELAQGVDRPAQNASFRFVSGGKVEEFKPEKPGLRIKRAELIEKIIAGLAELEGSEKERTVQAAVETTKPEVETSEVNTLGIRELIGKGESWYAGSITNRIFNLKKAADALNGVLVAPGDTFSFNRVVGEISQATGYKSAFIIKDGKTILGDGGGVCQTSSTLFRAVLAAGLPIEERAAHAYRVSYYEQNYEPGFDATIFQPAPDFKFKNDTTGHILIQTVFDESKKYLSFELYGTSDGRKVELSKARKWDIAAPPPDLYIDDPNLEVGKVVQTEHRASGAKVAFDWKVTRGEEVLQERTFYSNYRPWQAVYLRGTKVI